MKTRRLTRGAVALVARMFSRSAVVAVAISAACCSGGGVTTPSQRFPNVVGIYSGTVTLTYPGYSYSRMCPASTIVDQRGEVVIFAPLVVGGDCGDTSWLELGTVSIDENGTVQQTLGGTVETDDCGTVSIGGGIVFAGRELRVTITNDYSAAEEICADVVVTVLLSR